MVIEFGRKIENFFIFVVMKFFIIILFLFSFSLLASSQEIKDKVTVYQSFEVDTLAKYPYGNDSLYNFLREGLKSIDPNKCGGIVMASFMVDTVGEVSMIKIVRSPCPEAETMLFETVKNMCQWQAAWKNGQKVKSLVNIPVKIYTLPPPEFKQ